MDNIGRYLGYNLMFSQIEILAKLPIMSLSSIIHVLIFVLFNTNISYVKFIVGIICISTIFFREFIKPFCYPNWFYIYYPIDVQSYFNDLDTHNYHNPLYRYTIFFFKSLEKKYSAIVFYCFIFSHLLEWGVVCWLIS